LEGLILEFYQRIPSAGLGESSKGLIPMKLQAGYDIRPEHQLRDLEFAQEPLSRT
jgi:hypothetical protein